MPESEDALGMYVKCYGCGRETPWDNDEMKRNGWKIVDIPKPPTARYPEGYYEQTQVCPECVQYTAIEPADEWPDVIG